MTCDWRLRRGCADDAAALSLVAGATFLETFAGVLAGSDIVAHCRAKSSVEAFAAFVDDPACIASLAEHPVTAAPVGYTLLTPPDLPIDANVGDIELRRIYALSMSRGTGLGTRLMAHAASDAKSIGKTRIVLGVLGTNQRAREFYEREGFVLAGDRRFRVGTEWHDDVIYALGLSN